MMVVFFQNKINNNNKDSGQCKQVELIILHTIRNMIQESVSKSFLIWVSLFYLLFYNVTELAVECIIMLAEQNATNAKCQGIMVRKV